MQAPATLAGVSSGLAQGPPPRRVSNWRARLFQDAVHTVITVVALAGLGVVLSGLLKWGVLQAVWPGDAPQACRETSGACWAFLGQKYRQILFGIYPPGLQWRPATASAVLLALILGSLAPATWRKSLLVVWALGAAVALLLLSGGVLGLESVPTSAWGGLPVTLLLAIGALGLGMPLGIALALGRRARMPVVRFISIGWIELVRGVPLVSLLFVASIMVPLMLPQGRSIDALLRAMAALTICASAYLAETVRGGLQSVHRGQMEASQALGMRWWPATRFIVLPQALQKVIPPLTNTAIVMIKNTSLVLIVGLFDLLSSARASLIDPQWPTPYAETFGFVAAIYFAICFGLSRYALWLERRFSQSTPAREHFPSS